MFAVNENYLSLSHDYLFAEIRNRVEEYKKKHRGKEIIRLGIGDVTLPLIPAVTEALHKAVEEMGKRKRSEDTGAAGDMNFCEMP